MLAPAIQFMIIAMAGLPASGKSAVAERLRDALPAVLLDKDAVRAFLFTKHVDYSREQNDLCLDIIYNVSTYLLQHKLAPRILLDGRTYSRRYQIDAVKRTADQAGVPLYILECICSEASAKMRLEHDQQAHPAQDRNFAMYQRSRAAAEPINEPKLTIETDKHSLDRCVELALDYLRAAS